MDMANTDIDIQPGNSQKVFSILALPFLLAFSHQVFAFDWVFRPTLNVSEIFSDNINQQNNEKKTALVTEVSPGFSLRSTSTINTFNLNYRMQNLYNAGGNSGLDINNQLLLNSTYRFKRNSLYMDTQSSISQQNVSNRNIASDNITGGTNSTTVSTFSISPYWTPHLKSFADGEVRVTYNRVSTSGGQSTLSDTNTFSQNIRLNSGRDFSRFTWFVSFNNQVNQNSNGPNVEFQDSTIELRSFLNRRWSGFIRVGHQSNQFQTTTDSNKNGLFYTAGAQWRPSARLSVEAGYGNNKFVTVNILPIRRITWSTTYTNNDIGTNRGSRWQSSLRYSTRRSNWSFNYSENTVTTQQVLLQQQIQNTNQVFVGTGGQNNSILFVRNLPTLTDEVFVTKRADLTFSFRTGKSNFLLNGYRERRTFEVSQNKEDVYGLSGNWNWNFSPRSSSNIRMIWQTTEGQDATSDERFEASVRVTRNIASLMNSRNLNGGIEYRFINQQSDLSVNEFSENRITANLSIQF